MKGRGGVIINTASIGGLFIIPFNPVYAATKAAVVHFSRSLAYLGPAEGIRVAAICPGFAVSLQRCAWWGWRRRASAALVRSMAMDAANCSRYHLQPCRRDVVRVSVCVQETPLIADVKHVIADAVVMGGGLLTADTVADVVMTVLERSGRELDGAVVAVSAKVGALTIPYSTGAIIKSGSKL
jgi:short-subunit dehydrogenase